jgi:hypothetical protein
VRSVGPAQTQASGEITPKAPSGPRTQASGEINPRPAAAPPPAPHRVITTPVPAAAPPKRAHEIEVPQSVDDITQPGVQPTKTPTVRATTSVEPDDGAALSQGSIMGIGMGTIGSLPAVAKTSASSGAGGMASGEIQKKIAPGARVLVAGPDGLMQSATVRQLLQGYYELEVGGSGETIWVPMNGVVPE